MLPRYRLLLLIFTLCLFPLADVMATALPMHFGIRAGHGNGEVSGSHIGTDTEPSPASAFGITASYWLKPTLSIHSELLFSLRGGIQGRSVDVYNRDTGFFAYHIDIRTEWRLQYIELPILIKFGKSDMVRASGSGRTFSPFFEYGLSFGVMVHKESTEEVDKRYPTWTPVPDEEYDPYKPGFGSVEVSFAVGGGGDLQLGSGFASMQLRFRAGMGSIGGKSQEAQTRDILFLMGYSWQVKF